MKFSISSLFGAAAVLCLLSLSAYAQANTCGVQDYECKVAAAAARIAANPGDGEAYYDRGLAYGKLSRFDEAARDFTKYIASKPANKEYLADGYNERANSYKSLGQYKPAIADYNTALSLFVSTTYYNNRGNCYMSMGDNASALADFNTALAIDAKSAEPYYNRAKIFSSQKLYSKAIADLDIYVTLNTTNIPFLADGYQNRALAHMNMNNLTQALKDATRSIDLDPEVSGRYGVRASIYRKLGKIALAEADEATVARLK